MIHLLLIRNSHVAGLQGCVACHFYPWEGLRSSKLGSSSSGSHCVVFLGKTPCSHSAFLYPSVPKNEILGGDYVVHKDYIWGEGGVEMSLVTSYLGHQRK